jgi:hypothetical protein
VIPRTIFLQQFADQTSQIVLVLQVCLAHRATLGANNACAVDHHDLRNLLLLLSRAAQEGVDSVGRRLTDRVGDLEILGESWNQRAREILLGRDANRLEAARTQIGVEMVAEEQNSVVESGIS